ncbi:hypothetical protein CCH79_00015686 [Gambusia affinis]|uniref:Uncharacterized protein n=1 Tax=Gambusia affinis TaxID=33528 RepID=A0A315W4Y7_GAMAF|nr:hypothetical protein CCH79_00015686 [Gambusia affinis]
MALVCLEQGLTRCRCKPAEAAVVRQQVVELLQGNLEAGHVEAVRERRLSAPLLFAPHVRRGVPQDLQQAHLAGGEAADRCRLTGLEAAHNSGCNFAARQRRTFKKLSILCESRRRQDNRKLNLFSMVTRSWPRNVTDGHLVMNSVPPQQDSSDLSETFSTASWTHRHFSSPADLDIPSAETSDVQRTETGQKGYPCHHLAPQPTTDMSDSETTAAPAEAPVPAACASVKADLDKWQSEAQSDNLQQPAGCYITDDNETQQRGERGTTASYRELMKPWEESQRMRLHVAEKGAEGCKELMEAFAACVKSAAEGTSSSRSGLHTLVPEGTRDVNASFPLSGTASGVDGCQTPGLKLLSCNI